MPFRKARVCVKCLEVLEPLVVKMTNGSVAKCVCHINVNVIQMVLITCTWASIVKPNEKLKWGSSEISCNVF